MKKMKFIIPILGMTAGVTAITPTLVSCNKQEFDIHLVGSKEATISDASDKVQFVATAIGEFEEFKIQGESACLVCVIPYEKIDDQYMVTDKILLGGSLYDHLIVCKKNGIFNFKLGMDTSKVQSCEVINFDLHIMFLEKNSAHTKVIDGFKFTYSPE